MKTYKKMLSLLFAIILVILSTISAFAQGASDGENEAEVELSKFTRQLMYDSWEYTDIYVSESLVGALQSVPESRIEFENFVTQIEKYHLEVVEGIRETTLEEIDNYYKELEKAAKNVIVLNKELEFLLLLCKQENNDNSYYPEEDWNKFQDKLTIAQQICDKGEDTIEVSNAYWDLLYAFNDICIVNQLPYDVDFDGEISIIDATLIQRYLAGLYDFNSSQLIVLSEGNRKRINVIMATQIQRHLVQLEAELESFELNYLTENADVMALNINDVYSWYRFIWIYDFFDGFLPSFD